jgi:hypothetical protein
MHEDGEPVREDKLLKGNVHLLTENGKANQEGSQENTAHGNSFC